LLLYTRLEGSLEVHSFPYLQSHLIRIASMVFEKMILAEQQCRMVVRMYQQMGIVSPASSFPSVPHG